MSFSKRVSPVSKAFGIRVFTALLFTFFALTASAVTLEWDRNVEPAVVGYRAYCGTASRSYGVVQDVGNNTTASMTNLLPGTTYYFAVTAYTADGLESDFSEEVSYTVPGANAIPVANADSFTTVKATTLSVSATDGVLKNDSDADADPLTALKVTNPANGTVTLNGNGSFTYTPNSAFVGTDSFSYRVSDGKATSSVAVATITVTAPPNTVPVAAADSYTTMKATALSVTAVNGVLKNDTDADADPLTALKVTNPANGTVTLNGNGSFTYTPNSAFVGTDSFSYRVSDGKATSSVAVATITVTAPPNIAPVAAADTYTTVKATALSVTAANGVLKNDTDADADPLTAVLVSNPASGTLSLSASGSFTYTPGSSFIGTDSFSYRANDGKTNSLVATVTITVTAPPNSAPVAAADSYTTVKATALSITAANGVLKNDTDADADALTAVKVTNPANGSVTLNSNGSFTYTPSSSFVGTDSFSYRANDGKTNSSVATVTITVTAPPNSAPVAAADSYTTMKATALSVTAANGVLKNDTDADADPLTAVLVSNPANGTLSLSASGSFTYTPSSSFVGTDTFSYRANDGKTNSSAATVTITVTAPPNSAPVAAADSYTTMKATALSVSTANGVLKNDTDADADSLTVVLVNNPANGTLSLSANGSFTYTPNSSFLGTDNFSYRASDGKTNSSVATVTIGVTALPNSAPVAVADSFTTMKATPLSVTALNGVLKNDTDADADPLAAVLVNSPANGTLTLNANGSFTYTPNSSFLGADTFSYRASDDKTNSSTATVSITVTAPPNSAPVAAADSYTTMKAAALSVTAANGVLKNDTDADSDPLTVLLVNSSANGTLSLSANGAFTYTPNSTFTGTDNFSYRVSDGKATSSVAIATITVTAPPNSVPVAAPDSFTTMKATALSVSSANGVLKNDTDADADLLTAVLVNSPANGTLSLSGNGSFTYTPNSTFAGSDSFTYRANDGKTNSSVATVTISVTAPTNRAPVAVADAYSTTKKTTLIVSASGGVLANDSDPDGDTLLAVVDAPPAHGTVTLSADGSMSYTPSASFVGTDSFTYFVYDGRAASPVVAVTLTVKDVTGPMAKSDNYRGGKKAPLLVSAEAGVLSNDVAAEGAILSAVLVSPTTQGELSLAANGSFTYLPGTNFIGSDAFSYIVSDGNSTSAVATVVIVIDEAPEIPCVDCFVELDALLVSRTVEFAKVLDVRAAMSTNGSCLEAGLTTLGAIARAAKKIEDPALTSAITSSMDCMTASVRDRLADQKAIVSVMLPSRWCLAASNQIVKVESVLSSAAATTDVYLRARLVGSLGKMMSRIDLYLANGTVAPPTLEDRSIQCSLTIGKDKITQVLSLGTSTFIARDLNGRMVATGTFTYRRDDWNKGTLTLTYQGVPRTESVSITFTTSRWKLQGQQMRGYAITR